MSFRGPLDPRLPRWVGVEAAGPRWWPGAAGRVTGGQIPCQRPCSRVREGAGSSNGHTARTPHGGAEAEEQLMIALADGQRSRWTVLIVALIAALTLVAAG